MTDIVCQRAPTPVLHMRSTVIVSGVNILRARGLFDRYAAQLSASARAAILEALAGTWLPTPVVMEHFGAIESLGLTPEESFDIGATSGRRFGTTLWGTLVRVARAAGADPWIPLRSYDRIFCRAVDGGGFTVRQLGPKEATIEMFSVPFVRHAYFRHACGGAHATLVEFLAETAYVKEIPRPSYPGTFLMRLSWV
jgi:hypothetical protein